MNSEQKNKLFIATFLEDKNIRKLIKKLNSKTENLLKIVSAEKIHITWKFIGDIDLQENEKVFDIVKEYSHIIKNCSISFDRLEVWPNSKYPRLVALTSKTYDEKFANFFKNLEESLYKNLKIKKEKKGFIPHITIARMKHIKNVDLLEDLDFKPIKLNINHTAVVQSIDCLNGTLYKILYDEV